MNYLTLWVYNIFMHYIANLVTCFITRYIPSFSCYIAKVVYNMKCMLYKTSQQICSSRFQVWFICSWAVTAWTCFSGQCGGSRYKYLPWRSLPIGPLTPFRARAQGARAAPPQPCPPVTLTDGPGPKSDSESPAWPRLSVRPAPPAPGPAQPESRHNEGDCSSSSIIFHDDSSSIIFHDSLKMMIIWTMTFPGTS